MLSLNNISLELFNKRLFSSLSLTILPGAIVHISGRNGAGKTSLLRIIAGLQQPSSGGVFFGKNAIPSVDMIKPYCNYVGHKAGLKAELTMLENIEFWAKIYGGTMLIPSAIHFLQLDDIIDDKLADLSSGNQKKAALARLLVCPAEIWLLDELDSNLDEQNKNKLNNLIALKANNGGIVLLTSHNKSQVESTTNINIDEYNDNEAFSDPE